MDTAEGDRQKLKSILAKLIYGSDELEKRITTFSQLLHEQPTEAGQAQADLKTSKAELRKVVRLRKEFVLNQATRLPGN